MKKKYLWEQKDILTYARKFLSNQLALPVRRLGLRPISGLGGGGSYLPPYYSPSCFPISIFLISPSRRHIHARTYLQPHYGNGFFGNVCLSAVQHRGKLCRHPVALMGILDTFGPYIPISPSMYFIFSTFLLLHHSPFALSPFPFFPFPHSEKPHSTYAQLSSALPINRSKVCRRTMLNESQSENLIFFREKIRPL